MSSCQTNYIPAAQALYRQLTRPPFHGGAGYARLTVLMTDSLVETLCSSCKAGNSMRVCVTLEYLMDFLLSLIVKINHCLVGYISRNGTRLNDT